MYATARRFVVRSKHDRRVIGATKSSTLRRVVRTVPPVLGRAVVLAPRAPKLSWLASSKQGRRAKLELRATSVRVARPATMPSSRFRAPESLRLQLVYVSEIDPPDGYAPVDWLLLTNEPVDTPADVARVIDCYDARWGIEEYFKALKTGCAVAKRQLESAATIFNAIAIFMPIAVRLLALKHEAITTPDAPAHAALPELHIRVLQAHPDVRLPANPTAADAWLGVARLGGHLKRNGRPGWQVLWRGWNTLDTLAQGARIASAWTCDQS